ncbi:MAG: Ni/Fe hydrogenase subunit gamma [Burkholderiales bacterium]|nr:Ni/Fe hydrogenase subunit gamma [Burkholderiales bacterium]
MSGTEVMHNAILPTVARVRRRCPEGPQIWTLEIEAVDGEALQFAPGQFNMLTAFGIGEVPVSMSGDPRPGMPLLHTVRAVGPVSSALASLSAGDMFGLRGPFGNGWPMKKAERRDVIVLAGGLGIAPLRPAIYHLLAKRERYRKILILYGSRSPEDILFSHDLDRWRRQIEVGVTVDHAGEHWRGHVGVVTTFISRANFDPNNTVAMVCGPELMMTFAVASLQDAGVADDFIFLSMERNMKCAVGLCGHCQLGTALVCRDGPVFGFDQVRHMLAIREI